MKAPGRGTILVAVAPGLFLFLLAVCWPAVHGIGAMLSAPSIDPALLTEGVWFRTIGWSVLVVVVSLVPGLIGAHLMAPILRASRGARIAGVLCLAPLVVPGYAVFWCWWQALGPGTAVGDWALGLDAAVVLREVVLLVAMACWSWPLIAWPLALSRFGRSHAMVELAALDGAPPLRRLGIRWREDRSALALGCVLVAFVTAGSTISFDLAQVATVGFELRALDAVGVPAGSLLRASLPSMLLASVAVGLLLLLVRRPGVRWRSALALRGTQRQATGSRWTALLALVGVTALLPLALAFGALRSLDPVQFWSLHSEATLRTLAGAVCDGLLGALLAMSLLVQLVHGGTFLRPVARMTALLWVGVAFLPSIAICAALAAAYNTRLLGPLVYDSGGALLLGHLLRTGGIACLITLFFVHRDARSERSVRRLDPPRLRSVVPHLRAAGLLSFGICTVFSLGELVVTSRLAPPGDVRIATTLLNAMHYQRPDTVLFALGGLAFLGWGGALLLSRAFSVRRVGGCGPLVPVLLAALLLPIPGCDRPAPETFDDRTLSVEIMVGAPGRGEGLFQFPRGIALDAERNRFYVVDKTARVQRFSLDGVLEAWWQLPESTVGKPVGISVAPDGRVFVPDTHYHRIMVFDPDGRELRRFGGFGTGPGEFVYPTDIAFAPDGTLYVAEYGTNDRIQVLSPEGEHIRSFGRFGREDGEFARPQSIALSSERGELYVADTCNHRIGVHALDGTWLRSLAGPGVEAGRLSYPHGLELLPDGSLLVSEIGTDRIQRLDALTGRSLGTWGSSGFERGRLRTPWGVASDGERLLILDSGNSRVQIAPLPEPFDI